MKKRLNQILACILITVQIVTQCSFANVYAEEISDEIEKIQEEKEVVSTSEDGEKEVGISPAPTADNEEEAVANPSPIADDEEEAVVSPSPIIDEDKQDEVTDEKTAENEEKIYSVKFVDGINDEIIVEVEVKHGEKAEVPEIPEHKGYEFKEWNIDFTSVTSDLEVKAIYSEIEEADEKTEEKPSFDKSENGVTVSASEGILPVGTELKVEELDSDSVEENVYDLINLNQVVTAIKVVDIDLMKDNEKVSFEGSVDVEIGLDLEYAEEVKAYYVNGNNLEELAASKTDNGVKFSTSHFSKYAVVGIATVDNSDINLFSNTYTVTFDDNNFSKTEVSVNEGEKVTRPSDPVISYAHQYVFVGWYKDNNTFLNEWDFDNDVITEDITLYAKWKVESRTYTFQYYLRDGINEDIFVESFGETITNSSTDIPKPTDTSVNSKVPTDYVWNGVWYTNLTMTNEFTMDYIISRMNNPVYIDNSIIRLYGKLVTPHTVSFNSNGGSAVAPQTVGDGCKVTRPSDPTKAGYDFVGWSRSPYGYSVWNFDVDTVNSNMTLYAEWVSSGSETHTVTFDSKGGSAVPSKIVFHNKPVEKPANPTKSGYIFGGWYKDEELTQIWDFEKDITEDITLYAGWANPNEYFTIHFVTGTEQVIKDQRVKAGEKGTLVRVNQTKDKIFEGWFTDSSFENGWNLGVTPIIQDITLYAKLADRTYTRVTWMWNNGNTIFSWDNAPINSVISDVIWNDTRMNGAAAQPYFGAWYLDKECTIPYTRDKVVTPDDLTAYTTGNTTYSFDIYAKGLFTVKFNLQGGIGQPSDQQVTFNEKLEKPTDPTKTGYIFLGWYTDAGYTNKWNFDNSTIKYPTDTGVVGNTLNLYAKWLDVNTEFTVTFNSNGGSTVASQSVRYNNTVSEPAEPTNGEMLFKGWYTDTYYTTKWNFATDKVTEDITLYAKWETNVPKFTVFFNCEGGSDVAPIEVDQYEKITEPEEPTKEGYIFMGWYQDKISYGSTIYYYNKWNFNTAVTSNMTLYAKWLDESTPKYTLTFDADGGTPVTQTQQVYKGEYPEEPISPTKEGYVFRGWYYLNGEIKYDFNSSTSVYGPKTYYATWIDENTPLYTVIFDFQDASIANQTQQYYEGEYITSTPWGYKAGYRNAGWYTEPECTNVFNINKTPITEDITLYVKWKLNSEPYIVTFDSDGGTSVPSQEIAQGGYATEPNPAPTKEGYNFEYWYEEYYTKGQLESTTSFRFTTSAIYADRNLKAKWSLAGNAVTFNSNGGSAVDTQYIADGEKVEKPTNPTKEGYTFKGWYADEEFNTEWNFDNDTVSEEMTLYAKWATNYSVTFNSNGGSDVATQTIADGDKVSKPTDPTKEHYTFKGWYKNSELTTEWNFESDTVTEATILYAKWEENAKYTVTFETWGGTEVENQIVYEGENAVYPTGVKDERNNPIKYWIIPKEGYTIDDCYNNEYHFYDWNSGFNYKIFNFDTQITEDITIYALYDCNENIDVIYHFKDYNGNDATSHEQNGVFYGKSLNNKYYSTDSSIYNYDGHYNPRQVILELGTFSEDNYKIDYKGTSYYASTPFSFNKYLVENYYKDPEYTEVIGCNDSITSDDGEFHIYVKQYAIIFYYYFDDFKDTHNHVGNYIIPPGNPTSTFDIFELGTTFTADDLAEGNWYVSDIGLKPFTTKYPSGLTTTEHLYEARKINVKFETNGLDDIDDFALEYSNCNTNLPKPTDVNGYIFKGWYLDEDLTKPYTYYNASNIYVNKTYSDFYNDKRFESGAYVGVDEITLYAKTDYKIYYQYEFNGSTVKQEIAPYGKSSYEKDDLIPTNTSLTNFGATKPLSGGDTFIIDWYKEPEFTNKWDFATDTIQEPTTIYGKVVKASLKYTYTVGDTTYNSPYAMPAMALNSAGYGSKLDPNSSALKSFLMLDSLPKQVGEHLYLTGWYADEDCTEAFDLTQSCDKELIAYGKVENEPKCTVTFATGGLATVDSQSVYAGEKVTRPEKPTLPTDYVFMAWYKDSDYTELWNFNTDTISGATTIYGRICFNVYYEYEFNDTTVKHTIHADKAGHEVGDKIQTSTDLSYFGATKHLTGSSGDAFIVDWYKEPEFVNKWNFATDTVSEPITIYGKVEKASVVGKYILDGEEKVLTTLPAMTFGGYGQVMTPDNYAVQGAFLSGLPRKVGFSQYITGWYTDTDYTTDFSFAQAVNKELVAYGKTEIGIGVIDDKHSVNNRIYTSVGATIEEPDTPADDVDGFKFKCWVNENDEPYDFENETYTVPSTFTDDLKIVAYYEPTYEVSFNSNGGSAIVKQIIVENEKATEPSEPTKAGFKFLGWYTDNGTFANKWDFENDEVTENTVLYAKWVATYTVSFNTNGGSTVSIQMVVDGDKIEKPTNPTKSHYTFKGWFTDNTTFNNEWDFENDTVSANTTLYAKWEIETYDITFNTNGGNTVTTQNIAYNDKIVKPANPTKEHHIFKGWFTDNNTFSNEWDFDNDTVSAATTLYAKWEEIRFTVTFNTNGGSAVSQQSILEGSLAVEPTKPTKAGYRFDGWFTDNTTFNNKWYFNTEITENVTLYAKWTKAFRPVWVWNRPTDTKNVSYFSVEGLMTVDEYNTKVDMLPGVSNPSLSGYQFKGWYQDKECNTAWNHEEITEADLVDVNGNLYYYVYAGWKKVNTPTPKPTPKPEPSPNPSVDDPEPTPTPTPTDEPEPKPTDEPEPTPTDEPTPAPKDEPKPIIKPIPKVKPTPIPTNKPDSEDKNRDNGYNENGKNGSGTENTDNVLGNEVQAENKESVKITVVDKIDGVVKGVRIAQELEVGTPYSYKALDSKKYTYVETTEYGYVKKEKVLNFKALYEILNRKQIDGIAQEDTEIVFEYKRTF